MVNCEHLVTNKCVLFSTTMIVVICYNNDMKQIYASIRVEKGIKVSKYPSQEVRQIAAN